MAKHPVPKYKISKHRSKSRHSTWKKLTQDKLFGMVTKVKNLDLKGNLKLREKAKDKKVKRVKA